MKKFTLFALAMLCVANVKADEKIIYQDLLNSNLWETSRAGFPIDIVSAGAEGNYVQLGAGANVNGTRCNTFWGQAPWDLVTEMPETYYFSTDFNIEKWGNQSNNAAQRNMAFAIVNVPATASSMASYWGNAVALQNAETGADFIFQLRQCESGEQSGEGGYATAVDGTCYMSVNNGDSVNVAAGNWYTLELAITGQQVAYKIAGKFDGVVLTEGTSTLAEGVSNQVGGIITYNARYQSVLDFMNYKAYYDFEGDVAADPVVLLSAVQREARVYNVTIKENEMLHIVLPGEEEQEFDYWDMEDENTGNMGSKNFTISQSGTLKAWSTKGDATSNVVEVEVEAGLIQLPEPVAAIASVSEGFGKLYKISIDNASVLLSPAVALTYVINYEDGQTASGEVANGATLELAKAGTMVVTANSIPVAGVEMYDRNSVTIVNDVEYVCALDVQYHTWAEDHFADATKWTKVDFTDTNASHWAGKWMNEHPKGFGDEGVADWWKAPGQVFADINDVLSYLWFYELTNDEEGVNYDNELLPIIFNKARGYITILREEGIVANTTSYNNAEFTFDPKWTTDNPAKPNFIELVKTGGYDRYDKQPAQSVTIVKSDDASQMLYRFDTAINSARVFTYKGFTPGESGIESVKADAVAKEAIFNLYGQKAAAKGMFIQGGKVMLVK